MKRVWGHVLVGAAAIAVVAASFSGCVHDDSTIFVRDVLATKYQSSPGGVGCGFNNDPTQPYITSGVLDMALTQQYSATFLVGNQMLTQASAQQQRTETSTVTIQGAVVRITDSSGNQIKAFTRYTSATIDASDGTAPQWAPVSVLIVDDGTVASAAIQNSTIAAGQPGTVAGYVRLVTHTRFFGRSLGGEAVESDEFEFPVDVCNGCLIGFQDSSSLTEDGGATVPLQSPNCVAATSATGASTEAPPVPCSPGQDLILDCSLCQGLAACRGAYPNGTP